MLWASLMLSCGILLLWMRSYHIVDSLAFPEELADASQYERIAESHGGVFEWCTDKPYFYGGYDPTAAPAAN